MSITSICKNGFTKFVTENLQRSKAELKSSVFVPPLTKNGPLVGVAFDYLLRCEILRRYPNAKEVSNIAFLVEDRLTQMMQKGQRDISVILKKKIVEFRIDKLLADVKNTNKHFRLLKDEFLKTGKLTDEFLEATILIAKIDPLYRTKFKYISSDLSYVDKLDMEDLRELYKKVPQQFFSLGKQWSLDQTFPHASEMTTNADVDLIVDQTMIDIKTTKELRVDTEMWAQLVGYSILAEIESQKQLSKSLRRLESISRVMQLYGKLT